MIKKENQLLANALQVHLRWIFKSEMERMLCEKLPFSSILCKTEEDSYNAQFHICMEIFTGKKHLLICFQQQLCNIKYSYWIEFEKIFRREYNQKDTPQKFCVYVTILRVDRLDLLVLKQGLASVTCTLPQAYCNFLYSTIY